MHSSSSHQLPQITIDWGVFALNKGVQVLGLPGLVGDMKMKL